MMVKSLHSLAEAAEAALTPASRNYLSVSDVTINSLDGAVD